MRLSYAAIAALTTSVAYSQSIAGLVAQLPSCALVCLATAATGAQCGLSDYACQCGPARGAITQSATPCITSSCTPADAAKVLTISNEICAAAGAASSSASSVAAPVGSFAPSIAPSGGASPTPSSPASPTSSGPVQVSTNAASKVQAGAVIAGAAVLVAFAL